MRAYPIWNEVKACIYKGKNPKSWGARNDCSVSVRVGSSARNSHGFVNHRVIRTVYNTNNGRVVAFQFFVCGQLIKETIFSAGRNDRPEKKISEKCAYIGTMRNKRLKAS